MKFPSSLALAFLSAILSASATTIAVNHQSPAGTEGVGSFVFEVLEVQLSSLDGMELVDRKKLQEMLAEQSLGASGMTGEQAAKIGKLVGAKYYVFGETLPAGDRTAIKCRVVQVETGVLKPVLHICPKGEDPVVAGEKLAGLVAEAIGKLEGRATTAAPVEEEAKLKLPEGIKAPVFAFRIPEVSVTPATASADPAAEKSLEAYLQANGCKLVQLSRPSQSVSSSTPVAISASLGNHLEGAEHEALIAEAKSKGVDILVIGIAASERASQVGNFVAARARVELAAVRTRDSRILATTSGYGVGTDLGGFVAEKKAIESATVKLRGEFAQKAVEELGK